MQNIFHHLQIQHGALACMERREEVVSVEVYLKVERRIFFIDFRQKR